MRSLGGVLSVDRLQGVRHEEIDRGCDCHGGAGAGRDGCNESGCCRAAGKGASCRFIARDRLQCQAILSASLPIRLPPILSATILSAVLLCASLLLSTVSLLSALSLLWALSLRWSGAVRFRLRHGIWSVLVKALADVIMSKCGHVSAFDMFILTNLSFMARSRACP